MSASRPRSVQQKLIGMVLLSTVAAVLVAIAAMVLYDLRLYHTGWIADVTTQAELLGRTSGPALAFDDARAARENLELLRYRDEVRAAAIYDAKGRLFASYSPTDGAQFPSLAEGDGVRVEGDNLVLFKRIVGESEVLGTVYLRTYYALYDRLYGYLGIGVAAGLVSLLVAYGLSRRLQRGVTEPLRAIGAVARKVSLERNYSLRVQKLTQDEIGHLAEAFNVMLAEIERATAGLQASNRELEREVRERGRAEQEVLRLNAELERRVVERTAQLEYTNRELESFCYAVSHDLRGPLRAIDGFSQALLQDCLPQLPADGQRFLQRIRASTQRMGQLIEDLLTLSKVSRGELRKLEIDLSDLARHTVAELVQREPARNVEVTVWDNMQAQADPRLLRAALENLIANAWKFTAKAEHPRIEIGCLRDGERSTYFVRDNGVGFDMDYADKLFGAFQRLHSEKEFPGTGIGLATVQRIVHRHGGRIWANAAEGKGATFFFTLAADAAGAAGVLPANGNGGD
jgi:signal transduction histidine kinase